MNAEQQVKSKYSDAKTVRVVSPTDELLGYVVHANFKLVGKEIQFFELGRGQTEESAWLAAANGRSAWPPKPKEGK